MECHVCAYRNDDWKIAMELLAGPRTTDGYSNGMNVTTHTHTHSHTHTHTHTIN